MKKLSKTQKQMRETIGIDLGDKMSRYCIVNQDGEVVEEGSFRNQASSIEKHFGGRAAANRPGSRRAIGLDQPRAEATGARSHRGQSARVEVDHLERHQERSRRCAQAGAAGAGRCRSAGAGGASHRRTASRIGGDPSARCDPAGAHAVDQQRARASPRDLVCACRNRSPATFGKRALEGCRSFCARRSPDCWSRSMPSAGAIAGYDQTDRRVGRAASGSGAAGKYSRRGPAHGDDLRADAGPRRAIRAQSRCRRISGTAAEAAAERRARSAVGDFQKRRSLSAQAAGAVRASHSGSLRQRFGPAAMGTGQEPKAARKPRCGPSSRWPASCPCCCTGCG